jgi:hypothetical protein
MLVMTMIMVMWSRRLMKVMSKRVVVVVVVVMIWR